MRVPPGVTVFDSASWNGIAIDSTCGGHGTCHKCKVRVDAGRRRSPGTTSARSPPDQLGAGWRLACLAQATSDLAVDVPPLTTRPKAATVGVGRQVILRPAVQKRYVELDEPTLADQRTDLDRLLRRDRRPRADRRPRTCCAGCRSVLRAGRLQGHRGGRRRGADRRRARRHHRRSATRSPSTSAPRPSSPRCSTSTPARPVAVRVDAQQAAAVRRRRDHPDQRDDDRPGHARPAAGGGRARPCASSPSRCARRPASTRAHVYEVALAGNATMTALALGIDPEPLGVAPFVMTTADAADRAGHRPRARRPPAGPGRDLPLTRRVRRRRHRRGHARHRHGPRQAHPAVRRRRHQLRDRALRRRHRAGHRRTRRPGVRGRRDPLRHARRRRRDRGGEARPTTTWSSA